LDTPGDLSFSLLRRTRRPRLTDADRPKKLGQKKENNSERTIGEQDSVQFIAGVPARGLRH